MVDGPVSDRVSVTRSQRNSWARISATAEALLVATLVCGPSASNSQTGDDPSQQIDALTLQWTGLERQKVEIEANWRTDRPTLEQQLFLLERESLELSEFLQTTAARQDEVDAKRLELLEQQTRLEQEQASLEADLVVATGALRALHAQLPPPLLDAWTESLTRLDSPLLTTTEKLQSVLELVGQLDDFQLKVTLHEAVMRMDDGRDYEVRQVYLGLSHGWYVTADERFAAAGAADPDGWRWTAVGDGQPVTRIIDILERREAPELVSIPLRLKVLRRPEGSN
jgi:hypothetical protein